MGTLGLGVVPVCAVASGVSDAKESVSWLYAQQSISQVTAPKISESTTLPILFVAYSRGQKYLCSKHIHNYQTDIARVCKFIAEELLANLHHSDSIRIEAVTDDRHSKKNFWDVFRVGQKKLL